MAHSTAFRVQHRGAMVLNPGSCPFAGQLHPPYTGLHTQGHARTSPPRYSPAAPEAAANTA
jgi:hypothetical protein